MAHQVTAGRFVGRSQQLARLRQSLTHAAGGQPQVAVVGGEAGIGKTRLVEQLAATANRQDVRVLRGGCVPLGEEGLPFAPVVQALRGLAGDLDAAELEAVAGPARAELGRLLPDLAWGGEATAGAAGANQAGQGRLFELLLGVVQRLAARTPLLLVLEDLHWADRSTRDLLAYLAAALRSGRVLLVGTFRSDELDRLHPLRGLLGELARNRRVQRLELPRFSRAELAEQLAGLLDADPPTRLVDDIYTRSEGNPFFAEELLLAGEGADPRALPLSLKEVLLARVVRLGHRTQQLLRVTAAAGPGVTQPLLAAVTGMDEAALLDGLREAVDQQLLVPDGDGYVFRHALLAEAVYEELLAGERVRLHTALAGTLEAGLEVGEAPASRAARLAYHWSAAGDQPRALAASIQAAAAAEGVYAFAEAQLQLERALKLWDQVPDAQERAGMDRAMVLARCAEAASAAGDTARAVELVRQALPLVDAARQPQRAGLLHEQLARCLWLLGDPAALGAQQEAVRLVPPKPSAERARVLGSLAELLLVLEARPEEARGLAEEAVAIAGQVGAVAEEANARTSLGSALGYLGEVDAGLAELAAAVRLTKQAGAVVDLLRAILNHSDLLQAAGRLDEAATVAVGGLDETRRLGMSGAYGPLLAYNATEALVALGRWDQAEQVSREGLDVAPSDATSAPVLLARAALELGRGDLDRAEARLMAVRRLLPAPIPEAQKAGPLSAGLAELALWRGDLDQAKQVVAEAVPLVATIPRYAAPIYALGLRVEADRAELTRARRPGQPALDDGTASALLGRLDQAAAGPAAASFPELAAWHATGLAERTRQQGPSDPAAWAATAAVWERLGQPYRVAYACFRQAEALLATAGDRDTAAAALGRAAEITGRLGVRPLDAEAQALARASPPGPGPARRGHGLGGPGADGRRAAWPDPARGRGAGAGGGRAQQPPDRPGVVHQSQDRWRARLQPPGQAGRGRPGGGRRDRPPPGAGLTAGQHCAGRCCGVAAIAASRWRSRADWAATAARDVPPPDRDLGCPRRHRGTRTGGPGPWRRQYWWPEPAARWAGHWSRRWWPAATRSSGSPVRPPSGRPCGRWGPRRWWPTRSTPTPCARRCGGPPRRWSCTCFRRCRLAARARRRTWSRPTGCAGRGRPLLAAAVEAGVRRLVAESMVLVHGFGDFGATPLTEAAAATGSTQAMARKLRRRQLPLPGGGPGTISWVHVADAVTATVAALERGRPGEVYNVVDDEPVRWGDYTAELARLAEVPPPRSLPLWLARLLAPFGAGLLTTRLPVSNAKVRRELGWAPAFPTYREGLAELTTARTGVTSDW